VGSVSLRGECFTQRNHGLEREGERVKGRYGERVLKDRKTGSLYVSLTLVRMYLYIRLKNCVGLYIKWRMEGVSPL
jgi:hypothetical protein